MLFFHLSFHWCTSTAFNPNEVWAEGPGIEPEGMIVKQKAYFTVHTENAGEAKLEVKCIGPRKLNLCSIGFVKVHS